MVEQRVQSKGLRRFLPSTVIGQLVVGTILVQATVLILFLALDVEKQRVSQHSRDATRVAMQANLLAHLATNAMESKNAGELSRLTRALTSSAAVQLARVTDLQGNVLASSDDGLRPLDTMEQAALRHAVASGHFESFYRDKSSMEGLAVVMLHERPVGAVFVVQDAIAGYRTMHNVVLSALTYAISALLANVFLVALLGYTVSHPLRSLGRATQQVVRDPEDTSGFPLPITTRNEAGQLTHSFNSMVRELETQRSGLQETLALLDAMLENAPVGFAFFDREKRYVRANQFLEKIYGIPMQRNLGSTMSELFPGAIAVQMELAVEHVFDHGSDVQELELKGSLTRREELAEQRTWICNFYPVRLGPDYVRWVGMVMTEVTARTRAEEAMRRSEKLAAAGRLAASIAHEINNPLESVTNLLYLLREHASLDEEAIEYASLAQKELARVAEITQQTLRFYRSSTKPEMVHVADIVRSVLVLHAMRITSAKVTVEQRMDESAALFGFSGELRQVMANLVGNAVDAMSSGGVLQVRVCKTSHCGVEGVVVTVADSGIGMSDGVRRRIFEPFYTTKDVTGTGLGLWVSEEIVAKHGGSMRVRSRQKQEGASVSSGTVFRVFLPRTGVSKDDLAERKTLGLGIPVSSELSA